VSVNNTHCSDIGFDYHYKLWSMVNEYQCEFNFSDSSVSVWVLSLNQKILSV